MITLCLRSKAIPLILLLQILNLCLPKTKMCDQSLHFNSHIFSRKGICKTAANVSQDSQFIPLNAELTL